MQIIEYLKEIIIITKTRFMYGCEIIMYHRLFHPLGVQQHLQYHNEQQIIPIQELINEVIQGVIQEVIQEVIHGQLVNMEKHLSDGVVKGLFKQFFLIPIFKHFFFYRKDRYENYRIKPTSYPRERDHRDRERRLDKRR